MNIPISNLSQKKQAQLQLSNVIPPMYISIESYNYESSVKAVVYEIEVGIQNNQMVSTHVIHRRFSAMKTFDTQIRSQFGDSHYLLSFPPKTLFPNTSKAFLEQRSEQLQKYLANLVKIPGLSSSPTFTQFFEIDDSALSDM
ncbi:PX domain containing protein [Tritrichomonas foetus]|uniref:PX domain containing protein n=1 Tax=Tritrichomonas foetus TaxID=1144522 RepID=A0A1J4K0Y1_9EUKA|nr:PX domain containing protein [Tritrichomonas foetus]|eukprot:OHT04891.1 PX domain containing protein [Tritrichomonas foetus]